MLPEVSWPCYSSLISSILKILYLIFLILFNFYSIPSVSSTFLEEIVNWLEFTEGWFLHFLWTLLQLTCTHPQWRAKYPVPATFVKLAFQAFQSTPVTYFGFLLMLSVSFWFCSLVTFFVLVWRFKMTKKLGSCCLLILPGSSTNFFILNSVF